MESRKDTIFAPATAPGRSGIAVLRISGPRAGNVLLALGLSALPRPREATIAMLHSPKDGVLIDQALVLWFPSPASFTGESVAELHVHGSQAVMQKLCSLLSAMPGMRMAEPGEFAARAFANGKMDLTEIEGLADLIDAQTEAQRRQALAQMQGLLKRHCEDLRARVLRALALFEAYIDFPDEEIPEKALNAARQEISAMLTSMKTMLAEGERGERVREGVRIAILGAANAGKSSLFNFLAQRDLAIVSPYPGTTRDSIEAHLDIGGYAATVVDTAGLRESDDPVEREGQKRAQAVSDSADIRIVVFDGSVFPCFDPESLALIRAESLVVISKADALSAPVPKRIMDHAPLLISLVSQTGIEAMRTELLKRISNCCRQGAPVFLTRQRHRQAIENSSQHLKCALNTPALELACEELRLAAQAVGLLTGHIATEEILGEIFSQFCIGK